MKTFEEGLHYNGPYEIYSTAPSGGSITRRGYELLPTARPAYRPGSYTSDALLPETSTTNQPMENWKSWADFKEEQRLALNQAASYLDGLRRQLRTVKRRVPFDSRECARLERLIEICRTDLYGQGKAFEELVRDRRA